MDHTTSRNATILKSVCLVGVLAFPLIGFSDYVLHIAISILLWGFIYTSWSVMGRFGLVSLGHGAFLGVGAYGTTMLWNHFGLTPWIGIPIAVVASGIIGLLIGLPCFRFRITGHYFALVTLALTEVARLLIVALRDQTGGSLGVTPVGMVSPEEPISLYAFQFASKYVWFYIIVAVWLVGLLIWRAVDRSMLRYAMEAISQEEDAAASVGVQVTRTKLTVTVISAAMTAFGGAMYGQYQQYINPETVSGIAISLQIVFAVIAGGMFVQLGPTIGAVITILLGEGLRLGFGHDFHGLDVTIYGLMLILFIIYMPRGVLGKAIETFSTPRPRPAAPSAQPGE
jgi:branched-chain amino acid transport system permease protein